tara:strand:+ start:1488 stop:1955 length:468 start_codon:yes stop_codon:yes gene_type:complete
MLSESVRITSVGPGLLQLQPYNSGFCGSCSLKPSCGQYLLNSLHTERTLQLPVNCLAGSIDISTLKKGMHAQIKITAAKLVQLSLLLYILPLLLVLTSALLAALAGFTELISVVVVFITLLLSFIGMHSYIKNHVNAENMNIHVVVENQANIQLS